jgi:hypothetical protein
MNVVRFDEKCKRCGGTGLYTGMAERDGAAVVCHNCKGTGCHHMKFEYEDFEVRQKHETAKRVFQVNPGICIGEGNGHKLEDFGGMPIEDWEAGKSFKGTEDRKYSCPAWWYQIADYNKKPKWDKCLGCGAFSNCEHFANKSECWARFDKEFC